MEFAITTVAMDVTQSTDLSEIRRQYERDCVETRHDDDIELAQLIARRISQRYKYNYTLSTAYENDSLLLGTRYLHGTRLGCLTSRRFRC